jgi:IS1 family transposase
MALREKKQTRCQAHGAEGAGALGDHPAVTADSKLVVSLVGGKRTQEQTNALVHDAKRRLRAGHLPTIFTDAYAGYVSALLAAFGRRYSTRVQGRAPRSILRWPQSLAYGQVKKYEKGRGIERVEGRALSGKAWLQHVLALRGYKRINTSVVERHNGTSCLRQQRKVRKTLAFSKAPRSHRWMSWLSVGLYNFCRGHRSLKKGDYVVDKYKRALFARCLPSVKGFNDACWSAPGPLRNGPSSSTSATGSSASRWNGRPLCSRCAGPSRIGRSRPRSFWPTRRSIDVSTAESWTELQLQRSPPSVPPVPSRSICLRPGS